jgi:hypothetical protein
MSNPIDADILSITLTGTPLDSESGMADAAELFRALGIASTAWMRLEMHLDMVLLFLNQPQHSKTLCEKDHPVGFKSKIKLLKRWFNQHRALKHMSGEFRGLSGPILGLSKTRNIFLHSILSSFDLQTRQGVWRSIKAESEDTYKVAKHVGTVETLISFADEVNRTHFNLAAVTKKVMTVDVRGQLRTP